MKQIMQNDCTITYKYTPTYLVFAFGLPHVGTAELQTPFSKHSSIEAPFRGNPESQSYWTVDPIG